MAKNDAKKERKLPVVIQVVIIGSCIWAVVHGVRSRTWEDIMHYSVLVIIPFGLIALWGTYLQIAEDRQKLFSLKTLYDIFEVTLGTIIIGILSYTVSVAIKDAYLWLKFNIDSHWWTMSVIILITSSLGSLLWWFRLRFRAVYGFTEIGIGIAVAASKVVSDDGSEINKPTFYLALLTAGVYLIVRGLDNIHQGLTKKPKDNLAIKLLRLTNTYIILKRVQQFLEP